MVTGDWWLVTSLWSMVYGLWSMVYGLVYFFKPCLSVCPEGARG